MNWIAAEGISDQLLRSLPASVLEKTQSIWLKQIIFACCDTTAIGTWTIRFFMAGIFLRLM